MEPNLIGLGIIFALVGLLFFGAARVLVRSVPALKPMSVVENPQVSAVLKATHEAVLLVETGGRIRAINERARAVFQLAPTEDPNLDRISLRVRPSEVLLALCVNEGQVRLSVDERTFEASSLRISLPEPAMLIVMRPSEILVGQDELQGLRAQTIEAFMELTVSIGLSLDLRQTIQAVLDSVGKLLPADYLELALWDFESQSFTLYKWTDGRLLDNGLTVAQNDGFGGFFFKEKTALLIGDMEKRQDLRPGEGRMLGMHAYVGAPLLVGKEFVGTLELGSRTVEAFQERDLGMVRMVSSQAAIALQNALIYEQGQRRTMELSGLSQLSQAFSAVRDPKNLYSRLTTIIAGLFDVDILGFLIYNENQHILEGKASFHGLPDPFVELYRTAILPNSAAERTLLDQDVLITENATDDPQWEVLGLDHLAQAASLRDTALVPLNSGGHMLGYLQASNHRKGKLFSQNELHLLTIIANQATSIIENAMLVQQSRQRAQRAEALRQIISFTGSMATLDETLTFALHELARLLKADASAIFLLDSSATVLQLHHPSLTGQAEALSERSQRLLVDDLQYPQTVTSSQRSLIFSKIEPDQALLPFYQNILASWKIESLIAVPLVVRNTGVGEIWFGSRAANYFENVDIQLVVTAAGQLAGAVEQVNLRNQTDDGLRDRLNRLVAVTRISREMNKTLDLQVLIQMIHAEAIRGTGADCGSVVLLDLTRPAEEAGMVRLWHGDLHEPGLSDVEQRCVEQAAPFRITQFSLDKLPPPHAGIQSGLIVPILYQQRVAGLILLHGYRFDQFSETDEDICQSLAVQSAVAFGNALQFEEQARRSALLARELDTLAELLQVSRMLRPSLPLEESLTAIGGAIRQATPFQVNVISVCDPDTMMLHRLCSIGVAADAWADMQKRTQSWGAIQQLLAPMFKFGSVYYIPADKSPVLPAEIYTLTVTTPTIWLTAESWDPDDFLLLPLYDSNNLPLGLISIDAPADGRRPDKPTFEALEIFGIQAALMIENHRRTSFLERRVSEMEVEGARLHKSSGSATQNLPVLLRKDLEQTVALQSLNRRIDRIRASLEIASLATVQTDAESMLDVLASELLTRFALQTALVAEKSPAGIRLISVVGTVPETANPNALFGQRNPLRHMLTDSEYKESDVLLISNLDNNLDWKGTPLLNALDARSVVGLLLKGGGSLHYAVLVTGRRALAAFSEDDRNIFAQLARQVGVGLQNLQLLTETQQRLIEVNLLFDFSMKLSSLEPDSILNVLVDSVLAVLPAAQACWAGLLEPSQTVVYPQAAAGYRDLDAIRKVAFPVERETPVEEALTLQVYESGDLLRMGNVDFATQYRLSGENLMNYRTATQGRLPDSCLVFPLHLGNAIRGVMMVENFDVANAFQANDETLVYSFAQQAALALDNARLYQTAQQRAAQMQSLTRVSNLLTSSLKQEELLAALLDLLALVIPYETAILWARQAGNLIVRSAKGFEDNSALIGISVAESESVLFGDLMRQGEPLVIEDVRLDDRFPMLVEPENLSWMGLPLGVKGNLIGMIAVEKRQAGFYTYDHTHVAGTFSSQAAVALENARLFEESSARAAELDERSQRLGLLNQLSGQLGASLDVNEILNLTARQLLNALDGAGTAGVMLAPGGGSYVLEAEVPQSAIQLPQVFMNVPQLDRLRETHGVFVSGDARAESSLGSMLAGYWQPRGAIALLVVPLITGSTLHGWMAVDKQEPYRFTPAEIELARTICNQAATAIQNARQFDEIRSLTDFLEKRVEERTGELRHEHQNSQTLLRIISELSTSLDMGLVLNRALGVLNESFGSQESFLLMLHANQPSYRAGEVLAGVYDQDGQADKLDLAVTHFAVTTRSILTVSDINQDYRFDIPLDRAPRYRSVLAVPLMLGEDILGTLLMLHRQANFFQEDQVHLAEATARQLAIAINNAELFNLIRDQSEHLGKMLREQQIESSRSRAILEAVADGVVVTDDSGRINLFNASTERILGIKSTETVGKPLDSLGDGFGRSANAWKTTIHNWIENAKTNPEDTFGDRFELDNGSILSVNLAPVLWRSSFLGTVSIFRDITHEVRVDRLKTEFVANVSHELRTPLTSIKGYVEIMLMGASGQLSDSQRHFLQIVKNNTARLDILVNDLLDVSQIESGQVALNIEELNFERILEAVMLDVTWRSQEEKKPMHFIREVSDQLPVVKGDPVRVRQVVANLVNNSFNYTPAQGEVTVRVYPENGSVRVDVRDNGIGIHPDVQERIFERFYRGDDPLILATAGTGLGLAIARNLIEMHSGKIWFESSGLEGEGSTFSFTLPVYKNKE
jgi:PAS domain S-box-containing protein